MHAVCLRAVVDVARENEHDRLSAYWRVHRKRLKDAQNPGTYRFFVDQHYGAAMNENVAV